MTPGGFWKRGRTWLLEAIDMAVPLWIQTSTIFFPASKPLFILFFSINFYVNKSVTLFCTIPLDRMATYGLDNHTLGGNDLLKLLYQPMMFQNLGSAWLLEILFNISIEDLDEDCIRRYSVDQKTDLFSPAVLQLAYL